MAELLPAEGSAESETTLDSVAIVAMGASNQSWFKRAYNGDNYDFFGNIMRERFDKLLPSKEELRDRLRAGFKGVPLNEIQEKWLDDAAESFSPDEEQRKVIDQAAWAMGEQVTIAEIGLPYDEVWAINHMGKVLKDVDMIIAMDDLRVEKYRYGDMLTGDIPILTSKAYPEFPAAFEFPVNDAVDDLGWMYFTNSVVYGISYAMLKGVKRIGLYGCDFHYPGAARSEQARANAEFLLGVAHQRGITIEVPPGSTTMDMHVPTKFYGYAEQPTITRKDGTVLEFRNNDWLPVEGS